MPLPRTYQAKIAKNLTLTPRVHKIVLELTEPKTMEFTAGQFLMYQVSETVKRAYSIASAPKKNTKVELFIDLTPDGPASQYFASVNEETQCQFTAPYGKFTLRANQNDKIFIAGSTGVAPMRAMINDYLSREEDPSTRSARQNFARDDIKITLYFGVNKAEELFLVEEFRTLQKKHPNFKYIPVVAQPEKKWKGEVGLITEPLFREFGPTSPSSAGLRGINKDFYVCGSPAMTEVVKQELLDKGVSEERIFHEQY